MRLHLFALAQQPRGHPLRLYLRRGPSDEILWTADEDDAALYEREPWAAMVQMFLAARGFHDVYIWPIDLSLWEGRC